MGRDVGEVRFTADDRRRYRDKVRGGLDVLREMVADGVFARAEESVSTGIEIELNLVDANARPAFANGPVLEAIADPDFQTELGQFNVEINVPPRSLTGRSADELEASVRASLNAADARAAALGAHLVQIGILPTLQEHHLGAHSFSPDPRYALLNEAITAARGEDIRLRIDGVESLDTYADTIAPEAACTSVQFHLRTTDEEFPRAWNAAQAVAGAQVAVGANSPYLLGRELWRETRIALFQQATDTRTEELVAQGVRPRVWFGERWIDSVLDLFDENVRYFPALLPLCEDEDPAAVYADGGAPALAELRLHNGTVYRWNRPVYDVAGGEPHLRMENRVLPSGPSVADVVAGAAFHHGLVTGLAGQDDPVWTRLSFPAAERNFLLGARDGLDAVLEWPGLGEVPVRRLVLDQLLPVAADGLRRLGTDGDVADRLLGTIAGRCETGQNGASWQVATTRRIEAQGHDRTEALRRMTARYVEHMGANAPVHTWPRD